MHDAAKVLIDAASCRHLRLATAESCTGGMAAVVLTSIAGASRCFIGGVIAYEDTVKESALGVSQALLERYGAVSEAIAQAMCDGLFVRLQASAALAITGIAGPSGGCADKPVGRVCFGFRLGDAAAVSQTKQFTGDRRAIREAATEHALHTLGTLINQS